MTTQELRARLLSCVMAAGLALIVASGSEASTIYSVKDLGVVPPPSFDPSVIFPLHVDAAGVVSNTPAPLSGPYTFSEKPDPFPGPIRSFITDQSGTTTEIPIPRPYLFAVDTVNALGENRAGIVVGAASLRGLYPHPFIYQDGLTSRIPLANLFTPTKDVLALGDIHYPNEGVAYAINNAGRIVGTMLDGAKIQHAFVSDGTSTTDLNSLIGPGSPLILTSAVSINDLGQIAGYAVDAKGQTHEYLLTPTPEPGTLLSGSVMLVLVGVGSMLRGLLARS